MRELLRDHDAMRQLLKRRILRTSLSAVRKLDRIARGRGEFNLHELRACAVLARLAPIVLCPDDPDDQQQDPFDTPEWYTVEKLHTSEIIGPYDDEGDAAWEWGNCFRHNGAQPGLFATMEEAREYGRQRFRDYGKNHPDEPDGEPLAATPPDFQ
jgi:hypothetical protein